MLRPIFFLLVFALFPILSTSFRANSAERKIQVSEFGKTREEKPFTATSSQTITASKPSSFPMAQLLSR